MILTREGIEWKYNQGEAAQYIEEQVRLHRRWRRKHYARRASKGDIYDTFISHKDKDTRIALTVAQCLSDHQGKNVYIDEIDDALKMKGQNLGSYLREVIGRGRSLFVVVSHETLKSWWVPYEVGVGQTLEREGSVLKKCDGVNLPEYLKYWYWHPCEQLCSKCRMENWKQHIGLFL